MKVVLTQMLIGASTVTVRGDVMMPPNTASAPVALGTATAQLAGSDQFPSASSFQADAGGATAAGV